jgi:hypothetical protein
MIVLGILALSFTIIFKIYRNVQSGAQTALSERLLLQMEARKLADRLPQRIRECSEIVRPNMGESLPFVVLKDTFNNLVLIYLSEEKKPSGIETRKQTFQVIDYTNDYSGGFSAQREKILAGGVSRLSFTCHSPHSLQITATACNDRTDFQYIIQVGLMSIGGIE